MKSRALVTGLLAMGLCGAAQAEQGFYLGSGAGLYYVDIDGLDFDESAPVVRAFGGYELNEYVSFEFGFGKLFEASADIAGVDVDLDGTEWDLSVRPSFPLSDQFKAFGVLGYTSVEFDISATDQGVTVSDSSEDEEMFYGVGGDLKLNDNWNVRGEWIIVDVDDADFGMFSVSASYNFR